MNNAVSANDLKKDLQGLQIDANLANTTDLTAASSLTIDANLTNTTDSTAASSFTTPLSVSARNDSDISDEWKKFYDDIKKTPPKAARDVDFENAVAKANSLLSLSDIADFKNKLFKDLSDDQKAILMFMIIKEMGDLTFEGGRQATAKALISALVPESPECGRMLSFVGRGGDSTCSAESLVLEQFNLIRSEFVKSYKDATTIFQQNYAMLPYLHCQREWSSICAFTACSALIYYRSYGLGRNPSDSAITTNVSRFIRDEFKGLKIANLALTAKNGAYLDEILTIFMKSFGTVDQAPSSLSDGPFTSPSSTADSSERVFPLQIELEEEEGYNYTKLWLELQIGRPVALSIECFPGLADFEKKEYTGKLSDHYKENKCDYSNRCKNRGDREYHAVLCIGIKPRQGETPPMLLVQDSNWKRPAFSIGLDLLMDMGIRDLQFYTLPRKWTPHPSMAYKATEGSKVFFAGFPMSIDKNGKAQILSPKKPLPEKRDMSRYLHPPGKHQVYIV